MKLIVISIGVLFFLSTVTAVIIQSVQKNTLENSKTMNFEKNNPKNSANPVTKDIYTDWYWTSSIDETGETITPKDSDKFKLTFTQEGRLTSTTDCNQISGSFVKNEEVISVGPLMSTLMACEGETLESVYASQLALVTSYGIENNILTLQLLKDGGVMKFIKK